MEILDTLLLCILFSLSCIYFIYQCVQLFRVWWLHKTAKRIKIIGWDHAAEVDQTIQLEWEWRDGKRHLREWRYISVGYITETKDK